MATTGNVLGQRPRKSAFANRVDESGGKYPVDEYIIPASDDKGHSERITFRLSTTLAHELQQLVTCRKFPFREISEVIRWCAREGALFLHQQEDIPGSVSQQVEAVIRIARHEQFQVDYSRLFEGLDRTLVHARTANDWAHLRHIYLEIETALAKMPEGYWRSKYLLELATRYSHLATPAAPAGLMADPAPPPGWVPPPAPAPRAAPAIPPTPAAVIPIHRGRRATWSTHAPDDDDDLGGG